MRKLLFSASFLLAFGCSSQKGEVAKPQQDPVERSVEIESSKSQEVESIATDEDGPKTTSNGPTKMSGGKAQKATDADPSANEDRREMPRHNSPDQDKIDSIKEEEQKKKK